MAGLAMLYRSLGAMHRAGIPWPHALDSAKQPEAAARIRQGGSLADALRSSVPPLDLALLQAGERSGRLEPMFERLAERHDQELRQGREARSTMLYPMLVTHVGALLLPLPDLLQGRGGRGLLWSVLILVPMWALYLAMRRSQRAGPSSDPRVARRANPINAAGIDDADARALHALAATLDVGMPLGEALPLAARAGAGGRVCADLMAAIPVVGAGRPLAEVWRHTPEAHAQALRTAELSGDLPQAASHAASALAFEAEMIRKRWRSTLPVVMTLVLGAVIAARVIGFYTQHFKGLPGL